MQTRHENVSGNEIEALVEKVSIMWQNETPTHSPFVEANAATPEDEPSSVPHIAMPMPMSSNPLTLDVRLMNPGRD